MNGVLAFAALRGLLLGGALFALLAHALLVAGQPVPCWGMPLCTLGGGAAALLRARRAPGEPQAPGEPAPRWLFAATLAVVGVVAAALAYGATATPDRAWDGVVAWGLKAAALTAQASVQQPFFAEPAVFHHSADYPLLQPLCIASLAQCFGAAPARLLFPILYVLLVLLAGLAIRRQTQSGTAACVTALAVALTPVWINTSGGSFDSGYAEGFFALALTAAAAALLLRDGPLLLAAAVVMPLCKPEGSVHLLALVGACFLASNRSLLAAALLGGAAALLIWLPLQLRLGYQPPAGPMLATGTVAFAATVFGVRCALDRLGVGVRGRTYVLVALAALGVTVLVVGRPSLADHRGALLGQYLGGFERVLAKMPHVPAILGGLFQQAMLPRRFGFLFVVLLALPFVLGKRRADEPVAAVVLLLALGMCAVFGAFLLSPEPDVQHHLKSSAGRLLSHWVGVGWIVIGATVPALRWSRRSEPPGLPTAQ